MLIIGRNKDDSYNLICGSLGASFIFSTSKESIRVGTSWDNHSGMSGTSYYSLINHDILREILSINIVNILKLWESKNQ